MHVHVNVNVDDARRREEGGEARDAGREGARGEHRRAGALRRPLSGVSERGERRRLRLPRAQGTLRARAHEGGQLRRARRTLDRRPELRPRRQRAHQRAHGRHQGPQPAQRTQMTMTSLPPTPFSLKTLVTGTNTHTRMNCR